MTAETRAAATPHWVRGRFARWLFTTDHKQIGLLWLGVGAFGLALGGLLTLFTSLQTATADASVLGEGTYASIATMQGTLLTYGGILPLALGLAVAIAPLQVGARGVTRPAALAGAFWLGATGVLAIALSPLGSGAAPRSWWTTFPPLALVAERPSESARVMGLLLVSLAALVTALVLLETLRTRRAQGLTDERLPLFAGSTLLFSLGLVVLSLVSLLANVLLLLARANPGSFDWYITDDGGLLKGYGWVFNQGVAAIALVPALGAAAEIIATFNRGALGARKIATFAFAATAALIVVTPCADIVDAHAWATVLALAAAVAGSVVAASLLPAATRTLLTRRSEALASPFPFAVGALKLCLLGTIVTLLFLIQHDDLRGTTFESARLGLFLASALVGLAGGAVFWWPKLTGRSLDPRLTTLAAIVATGSAVLLAIGRMGAGWADQPSHTGVTTDDASTWALIGSLGAVGLVAGLGLVGLAVVAGARGRRVGNDPWLADTLEWYTTSPPPPWNFDSLPEVSSERPLADHRQALRDAGAF